MNYLKNARRDKKGAVISIILGVVFMLLYIGLIAVSNTIFKPTFDQYFNVHPIWTISVLLTAAIILFGIGFFSIARGVKLIDTFLPPMGAKQSTVNTITNELVQLNDPKHPFTITLNDQRLTAEWKLADAKWYTLFGKAGLKEKYTLYLRLDEKKKTVYAIEYLRSISWNASIPSAGWFWEFSYGWHALNVEWRRIYGIKDINPLSIGMVCSYQYNIDTIRLPIINAILKNGWSFRPAVFSLRMGI